jgi:hypothetical protein
VRVRPRVFSGKGSARPSGTAGLKKIENTKRIEKRKAGFISSPSQQIHSAENAIVNEGELLVPSAWYRITALSYFGDVILIGL